MASCRRLGYTPAMARIGLVLMCALFTLLAADAFADIPPTAAICPTPTGGWADTCFYTDSTVCPCGVNACARGADDQGYCEDRFGCGTTSCTDNQGCGSQQFCEPDTLESCGCSTDANHCFFYCAAGPAPTPTPAPVPQNPAPTVSNQNALLLGAALLLAGMWSVRRVARRR